MFIFQSQKMSIIIISENRKTTEMKLKSLGDYDNWLWILASPAAAAGWGRVFCFCSHVSGVSESSDAGLGGSFVKSGLESDVSLVST